MVIQKDPAPLCFLPNQTSVNTRVWEWINIMQGHDIDIRHIPGKENPADSLSRQLREDALGRKSQVCKEHGQWINSLPNCSIGCSLFFLNYGFHPTVPAELIKGNEEIRQETILLVECTEVGRLHGNA